MDLHLKFLHVTSHTILIINQLEVDKKYSIVMAERVVIHLGETVMLSVTDTPPKIYKIFLPKRYARVI